MSGGHERRLKQPWLSPHRLVPAWVPSRLGDERSLANLRGIGFDPRMKSRVTTFDFSKTLPTEIIGSQQEVIHLPRGHDVLPGRVLVPVEPGTSLRSIGAFVPD